MRKFGVEIELNSFDKRDFKVNPLAMNEFPKGMDYIANLIRNLNKSVSSTGWQHTHNNTNWVCKPDSSCGIEVCSPIFTDALEIVEVIDLLSKDKNVMADKRCSFHVHFDVSDCLVYDSYVDHKKINLDKSIELISILSWWIKCEAVFFDSFPDSRKVNRYCQFIGISDLFDLDEKINFSDFIDKLSNKYLSLNTNHLKKNFRPTIEFRTAENSACLDSNFAKNWILFLDNFISKSISKGLPESLAWLDPKEVFYFLDLNKNIGIRDWFLSRIFTNINSNISYWNSFRKHAFFEFKEILNNLQLDKQNCSYLDQKDK